MTRIYLDNCETLELWLDHVTKKIHLTVSNKDGNYLTFLNKTQAMYLYEKLDEILAEL